MNYEIIVYMYILPHRSAEQLLAAEAAEARRKSGRRSGGDFTGRATTGAKGAWGSISRVFSRNKHRRTLDTSILDGTSVFRTTAFVTVKS